EVDLDGLELRDGGENGLRTDEVADLRGGLSGDSGDERTHLREAEVDLRGGDGSLCGCNLGLCCGEVGLGLRGCLVLGVELALGDGMLRCERSVAVYVNLCELQLRLRLAYGSLGLTQLALGLIERRLEGARVDLEENGALLNDGAFAVVLLNEI